MEPRRALIAIVKDGVTPLCYKWSDNQQSDVPIVQYSEGRKITVRRADVAVPLRINIPTIRRAVLRRGCTLTYQHSDSPTGCTPTWLYPYVSTFRQSDGLYSDVAVPLRINISTIRRAVLRRGCTLTYQHSDSPTGCTPTWLYPYVSAFRQSDGLYSDVAVPLRINISTIRRAALRRGCTLTYQHSDSPTGCTPTWLYSYVSTFRQSDGLYSDVAVLLRINISTIRRAVLRRGCTLTYQHSDSPTGYTLRWLYPYMLLACLTRIYICQRH